MRDHLEGGQFVEKIRFHPRWDPLSEIFFSNPVKIKVFVWQKGENRGKKNRTFLFLNRLTSKFGKS